MRPIAPAVDHESMDARQLATLSWSGDLEFG
jgi:hypothetical protein